MTISRTLFNIIITLVAFVISYFSLFFLFSSANQNPSDGIIQSFYIFIVLSAVFVLWYSIYSFYKLENETGNSFSMFVIKNFVICLIFCLLIFVYITLYPPLRTELFITKNKEHLKVEEENFKFGESVQLDLVISNPTPFFKKFANREIKITANDASLSLPINMRISPFETRESFIYFNIVDKLFNADSGNFSQKQLVLKPGKNVIEVEFFNKNEFVIYVDSRGMKCENLSETTFRNQCFEALLESETNIENCAAIKDYIFVESCYLKFKDCSKVKDIYYKNECYSVLARNINYDFCKLIDNENQKKYCFSRACEKIAVNAADNWKFEYLQCKKLEDKNSKNISFCEQFYDLELQKMCKDEIRFGDIQAEIAD